VAPPGCSAPASVSTSRRSASGDRRLGKFRIKISGVPTLRQHKHPHWRYRSDRHDVKWIRRSLAPRPASILLAVAVVDRHLVRVGASPRGKFPDEFVARGDRRVTSFSATIGVRPGEGSATHRSRWRRRDAAAAESAAGVRALSDPHDALFPTSDGAPIHSIRPLLSRTMTVFFFAFSTTTDSARAFAAP